MTRAQFLAERQPDWRRLERLLTRAERHRVPRLTGDETAELSRLFRAVAYDLAMIRSRDWGLGLSRYLNNLVGRVHNSFYRSPPARTRAALRFLFEGFPALLRVHRRYFAVALILFVVPGLIAGVAVQSRPDLVSRFLSGEDLEQLEKMYSEDGVEERQENAGASGAMFGFYVHNNIGIAFRCFATGIFFGIGTVFFLVFNSIFLGVVTSFIISRGHEERFFTFVIGHGSFELTAIVIAGAAGLIIGHALLHPGSSSRADALARRGKDALLLALGAGAMLAVAALIEAFWSPSSVPGGLKYGAGGVLWAVVIAWLTLAGRGRATP